VVLGGIADIATLETISALAGERDVPTRTVGSSLDNEGRPRPSTTVSTVRQRRLPVDQIARGQPGMALALDGHNRVGWLELSPAHLRSPWRELVASGREPTTVDRPGAHRTPSTRDHRSGGEHRGPAGGRTELGRDDRSR
jgi:hypothetical protein